jgi:hypothetical protein
MMMIARQKQREKIGTSKLARAFGKRGRRKCSWLFFYLVASGFGVVCRVRLYA